MRLDENEIYEGLRISTIFSGHSFTADPTNLSWNDRRDDDFFHTHRGRRFLLRASNTGEFDAPYTADANAMIAAYRGLPAASPALRAVYTDIPPLWALVARLAPQFHIVTAVYRGSAFFSTVKHDSRIVAEGDDEFIGRLLALMTKRRGIDPQEWMAFERKFKATIAAMNGNNNNKVN